MLIDAMKNDFDAKLQYLTESQEAMIEKMANLKTSVNSGKMEMNMTNMNWANSADRLNDQSYELEKLKVSMKKVIEKQRNLDLNLKQLNETLIEGKRFQNQNITDNELENFYNNRTEQYLS